MQSLYLFVCSIRREILEPLFVPLHPRFADIDWGMLPKELAHRLEDVIKALPEKKQLFIRDTIDRIGQLSTQESQRLLIMLGSNSKDIFSLSEMERSCWMYLHDKDRFTKAEILLSNRRSGIQWGHYRIQSSPIQFDNSEMLDDFKGRIARVLGLPDREIIIHVSEHLRSEERGATLQSIRFDIYHPQLPNTHFFHDKEGIAYDRRCSIFSSVLMYIPSTGEIEVSTPDEALEFFVVHAFTDAFLKTLDVAERLLTLDPLLKKQPLAWDLEDNIASVDVESIVLKNSELNGRLQIDFPQHCQCDIHQYVDDYLNGSELLEAGVFLMIQVKIAIAFCPGSLTHHNKILPITLSVPNKCDVNNGTEYERAIGRKYLNKWGFFQEAI
jgi:hypothetical protein